MGAVRCRQALAACCFACVRPSPRGLPEIACAIDPNRMIENTLITRSSSAIAVASGSGTP